MYQLKTTRMSNVVSHTKMTDQLIDEALPANVETDMPVAPRREENREVGKLQQAFLKYRTRAMLELQLLIRESEANYRRNMASGYYTWASQDLSHTNALSKNLMIMEGIDSFRYQHKMPATLKKPQYDNLKEPTSCRYYARPAMYQSAAISGCNLPLKLESQKRMVTEISYDEYIAKKYGTQTEEVCDSVEVDA